MATSYNSTDKVTVLEYFLGLDEFNHPKIYTDQHAIYILLIRLILLEPGTYPNKPNMGVGLVSKYRYSVTEDLTSLKEDIQNQIDTFLPEFNQSEVKVEYTENKEISIAISLGEYEYDLIYNRDNNTLSAL